MSIGFLKKVLDSGFRVQGSGFGVRGSGSAPGACCSLIGDESFAHQLEVRS